MSCHVFATGEWYAPALGCRGTAQRSIQRTLGLYIRFEAFARANPGNLFLRSSQSVVVVVRPKLERSSRSTNKNSPLCLDGAHTTPHTTSKHTTYPIVSATGVVSDSNDGFAFLPHSPPPPVSLQYVLDWVMGLLKWNSGSPPALEHELEPKRDSVLDQARWL
ncbi:hypothetical protein K458DRAFT_198860 [Lentithecium fluviatile CBS 122367]|uniref:Uncharacterized protein n=1 Tax=Lentithecium fluviatile CBS 122367 TaxID=1168545 RepID=A0A6G1J7X4_9PLEO|nr:hypothetical protein K458DRAFT_198860 [Lentithecium fluviatile CBS 122367]